VFEFLLQLKNFTAPTIAKKNKDITTLSTEILSMSDIDFICLNHPEYKKSLVTLQHIKERNRDYYKDTFTVLREKLKALTEQETSLLSSLKENLTQNSTFEYMDEERQHNIIKRVEYVLESNKSILTELALVK